MYDMAGSVLIVEDEITAREMMEKYLTDKNYRVESFITAEAAMKRMLEGNSIALAVLDVTLPGMNGIALSEWIRKRFVAVPIIFVTADPKLVTNPGIIALGKPLNKDEFLNHVWQQIKMAHIYANHREIKSDFALTLDKLGELGETVGGLKESLDNNAKSDAEWRARQEATVMTVASRVEAAHREATNANTNATNAHVKVDSITVPGLIKGWRDKWDPVLTAVISFLFAATCWLVTQYKDQLLEKFNPASREVAAAKQELSVVKDDMKQTKHSVQNLAMEQTKIGAGQVALDKNMNTIMDSLSIPKEKRAAMPSPSSSPSPAP